MEEKSSPEQRVTRPISCGSRNFYEAESKEKHGVWYPIPELTITSPYVHSSVDSNKFTMGNPMPELTLTLCNAESTLSPSQGLRIWPLCWLNPENNLPDADPTFFSQ
jgi:hypothetical protein